MGVVNCADGDLVITPAGPRPRTALRHLAANQAVVQSDNVGPISVPHLNVRVAPGKGTDPIPDGHVLTPIGYRPKNLVRHLKRGHALQISGRMLQELDTATQRTQDVMSIDSPAVDSAASGGGWIAYASWTNDSGSAVTSFRTTWTVPPVPKTAGSQTVFLFNGLEDMDGVYILQPVLQWGISGAGGGPYWAISSWYCSKTLPTYYSDIVQVNVGDIITGVITLNSQTGGKFSYTAEFAGQAATSRSAQSASELKWCVQTLEAYGITQCSDYPDTSMTSMSNIFMQTKNGTPAVTWSAVNTVTDCQQKAVVASDGAQNGQVDLYYGTG